MIARLYQLPLFANVAQLEVRLTCNQKVEGSTPFVGSKINYDVAQLVERQIHILKVRSSNLLIVTKK